MMELSNVQLSYLLSAITTRLSMDIFEKSRVAERYIDCLDDRILIPAVPIFQLITYQVIEEEKKIS